MSERPRAARGTAPRSEGVSVPESRRGRAAAAGRGVSILVGSVLAVACARSSRRPVADPRGEAPSVSAAPVRAEHPPPQSAASHASAAAAAPRPTRLRCVDRAGKQWDEDVGAGASASAPAVEGNPANRVLAAARGNVRACYQAALDRDPATEGRMAFRLQVVGDGSVDHWCAGSTGTIGRNGAEACIAGVLSRLRFAPPEKGAASVRGSFSFVDAGAGAQAPDGATVTPAADDAGRGP